MSIRNLEALLQPRSVAVVGASSRAGSVGAVVWRNLRSGGFAGDLWPVNPRAQDLDGVQACPDVASLPGVPDLAVVCTPAAQVPGVIDQLGRRGTRAAVVITAGLREPLEPGGPTLEQQMLDAARPHLLRILGPNCIGLLVPRAGLNASFAPAQALPGHLAFVTQSGALATAMLDWAGARGIGFSHFVSLGDSADVDFGDMLDYLGSDAGTRAILLYVESVKHARKFMSAARAAARNKPVIVVKAGRHAAGARAAASHTGALAGSDTVFDAAVRRAGMLRVDGLEALFDAAATLARVTAWRGRRLAILTNGGGAGVLAADVLDGSDPLLANLAESTVAQLSAVLPATWSHANPVDIVGDAPATRYTDALRVLGAAPEVDGVLFMHAPTAIVPAPEIARECLPVVQALGKPVLACWLGGEHVAQAQRIFEDAGIACYETPERASAAWRQLADYHAAQEALLQLPSSDAGPPQATLDEAREVVRDALAAGREWLDAADANTVLRAYGIPTVATARVDSADAAVEAAARMGYPVALKIDSPQIIHKSDVGGVVLDLHNGDEVRNAAIRMRQRLARVLPQAHVRGYTVQAMARRPGAHELIVGIAADAVFGPVVLFGEGGTAVEIKGDRAVALPPLTADLARDLVGRTRVARLLAGYRGRPAADLPAVHATLVRVAQLACDLPEVAELDINPLLADADGVLALDARIRIRRADTLKRPALRPYPAALESSIQADGKTLAVRPIRPDDGARLQAFYAGATPADMRLRFFMARREIPHSELARYCQIDYEREMTFIALDGDTMVGEVRAVSDPDNLRAEFAMQVATEWQGRTVGRQLLAKMVAYLRSRGTAEVLGECLEENSPMASLARRLGFQVAPRADGVLALRLALQQA